MSHTDIDGPAPPEASPERRTTVVDLSGRHERGDLAHGRRHVLAARG